MKIDDKIILPKTIFLDIDGCILLHNGGNVSECLGVEPKILPGVSEKIDYWENLGYKIIITTSRKESLRKFTEEQLLQVGVAYDQLVMGLSMGERILINDLKPNGTHTARAIELVRNEGLTKIDL
jgi:hypothetical protein